MFIDPQDGMFDTSKYLTDNRFSFLPAPVIITEPAVGYGLGVVGIFFHESQEQREKRIAAGGSLLPANVSVLGAARTENGTWGIGGGHLGFWKNDTIRYKGFAGYPSINMDFYSLDGVELPQPIELSIDGFAFLNQIEKRIGASHWLVGLHQVYAKLDVARTDSVVPVLPAEFQQYVDQATGQSTTTSGLGVIVEYDSRDNPLNPVTGYQYTFRALRFDQAIGSDIDYNSYTVEGLNYWKLGDRFHLGLRVEYDAVSAAGDTRLPPYVPPGINLRGIPKGRYQGDSVLVTELQLDYQYSFRWRFGAFIGVGRAAADFGDLSDAPSEVSKGIGFRYLVARRYGFIMGIDVARGPDDSAFYIQAGSTW